MGDPLQIAAVKALGVGDLAPPFVDIRPVLFGIPAREAVHKDLIEHRPAAPIHLAVKICPVDVRILEEVIIALFVVVTDGQPFLRIIVRLAAAFEIKDISDARIGHIQHGGVIVEEIVRKALLHSDGLSRRQPIVLDRIDERDVVQIIFCRPQTDVQLMFAVSKGIPGFGNVVDRLFLHAPLVRFSDKFFEIFVRTEHLVDMEVVDGVVLMVARRSEHGR